MGYDSQLARGAVINLIGLVAKLVHPLFFVLITWFFGTSVVGLYFLAIFIVQVADSAVTAGYNDATTIFGSAHADPESPTAPQLYQVLGNAFAITLGLSGVLMLVGLFGIEPLVTSLYADKPELEGALRILLWSLPLTALPQVCIAATKALMFMGYDTSINGFAKPLVLLATSLLAWFLDAGLEGLMWAHVATQAVVTVLALWAFRRHFSLALTLQAIRNFRLEREMLRFALPQNLNMTFNRYLTRLDVIMLGAFGFSNHQLAYYSAAALVTSNLREIKLIFSSALGPIIARHHAAGDRQSLIRDLSRVTRWTTTLIVPAVLASVVLRDDILALVDPSFGPASGESSLFVVMLLVPPLLSCSLGLAGNTIVWTRHSTWNLVNSSLIALLNTGFNWLMIPWLGLEGAAIATVAASLMVSLLQLGELWMLERAFIAPSAVYKPWLGFALGLGALLLVWDPATLGTVGLRIGLAGALVASFFGLMLVLRHEEVVGTLRRVPSWLVVRRR